MGQIPRVGPVVIAYDGSDVAGFAIEEAGRALDPGRDVVVVCAWQPANVGFRSSGRRKVRAMSACEVRWAAEETAAHGASLARAAGLQPKPIAIQAAPGWQGLIDIAKESDAGLIVIGSPRRRGVIGNSFGGVAPAVVANFERTVMVVSERSEAEPEGQAKSTGTSRGSSLRGRYLASKITRSYRRSFMYRRSVLR